MVFHHLDHEEKYFPMVVRIDARAFFGLPPKALRPNPPAAISRGTATGCTPFTLPTRPTMSVSSHSGKGGTDIGAINGDYRSLYDDSNSEHEGMDITSYLPPTSMSSSASNALRAESPMDTALYHRRSLAPTPSTTLGDQCSARLSIAAKGFSLKVGPFYPLNLKYSANCLTKEKPQLQHERIAHLEEQLQVANAKLQAQIELTDSQDQKLAELRAQIDDLVAKLQREQEWLARIREEVITTPEIEGAARAGASGMKRAWIPEDRTDTSTSARASKRPKEPSERSGEMEFTAEYRVTSEDDD